MSESGLDAGRDGVGAGGKRQGRGLSRRWVGMRGFLASPLLFCTLLSLWWPCADAATAVYIVPVYEWVLVWKEWRNPAYKFGSIWRPKMIYNFDDTAGARNVNFPGDKNIELDGYDLRTYLSNNIDVVHIGDVFVAGHEPPNFVGSVLIVDKSGCFPAHAAPATSCTYHVPGGFVIWQAGGALTCRSHAAPPLVPSLRLITSRLFHCL